MKYEVNEELLPLEKKNEVSHKEEDQRKFMNVEEASRYLGVSKSCLYKKMSNREIPYYKPGGKTSFFKPEDLDNWVFQNRISSKEELIVEVDRRLKERGLAL